VTNLSLIQDDRNIREVIDLLNLPDHSKRIQVVRPLAGGNDGKVLKVFLNSKPHALKLYHKGLNVQYVNLQRALYHAAVPIGWVDHNGVVGLLFRFIESRPPHERQHATAEDRDQAKAQMEFLHWMGFCHLDITSRNLILGRGGKCFLLDHDHCCEFGCAPLSDLPPESSESIKAGFTAEREDDLHLWKHLQTTFFSDLPAEQL